MLVLLIQDWTVVASSLPICLPMLAGGEKLPEIAIWEAVGKGEYMWAEIGNKVGCRQYQVDLYTVMC